MYGVLHAFAYKTEYRKKTRIGGDPASAMLASRMREAANIETIRAIYSAFLRGDLDAALCRLDETIVWTEPLAGRHEGLEEARVFLESLKAEVTFREFDLRDFVAQGNRVVALVHYEGRVNRTGQTFDVESAMLWTLANGRAVRFREYADTKAFAMAALPSK